MPALRHRRRQERRSRAGTLHRPDGWRWRASKLTDWRDAALKIETSNEEFYRFYHQSVEDMAALRLPIEGTDHLEFVPAGGVPWFVALFGRDSLIVSLQNAMVYPEFRQRRAGGAGRYQAVKRDDYRDAEPGKIMHELRRGELAHFKLIPHTPYYGTADATILYLIVLHNAWRCTGDLDMLDRYHAGRGEVPDLDRQIRRPRRGRLPGIRDPIEGWRLQPGLEGFRRGAGRSDGSSSRGPKALVETAGLRLRRLAAHGPGLRRLGQAGPGPGAAQEGQGAVRTLQRRLLGRGVRLLRLLPRRREEAGAERRLQSGPMPVVRHRAPRTRRQGGQAADGTGHVERLGHPHPFGRPPRLQSQLLPERRGLAARQRPDRRWASAAMGSPTRPPASPATSAAPPAISCCHQMPELYSGMQRDPTNFPVQYLGANVPQAWAAGSCFAMLQMIIGFQPDAPAGKLYIDPPCPIGCRS